MNIGMLADIYQTHVSGVTNYISLCKKWLENAGHQVYVFSFGERDEVDEENKIILTRGLPIMDFYTNFHYNERANQLLYSMDIVHVQHPFVSGMIARRYCTPRNIPIVFSNHTRYDLYSQAYLPHLPKTMSNAGLKAYLSKFYRACDLVIIPAESMHRVLIDQFGLDAPVVIIPNGVDLEPFSGNIKSIDRQKFGFSSDHIITIFIGRLAPEKNLPFLLDAFADIAEHDPRMRLILVGDGPERKNLEDRVDRMKLGSKIYFSGLIPYLEVPSYLKSADIFVTPSLSEVFPLSIIEAIGAGLPVVGIDAPGTSDIIMDGVNGLITNNDGPSFTSKLLQLAADDHLRRKLGEQAVETSKQYDIRITIDKLIQHYERVIEASKLRGKIKH